MQSKNAIEEAERLAEVIRRSHHVNQFNPYEDLTDGQFIKNFRLNKSMADTVQGKLEPFMRDCYRSSDLDITTKVY